MSHDQDICKMIWESGIQPDPTKRHRGCSCSSISSHNEEKTGHEKNNDSRAHRSIRFFSYLHRALKTGEGDGLNCVVISVDFLKLASQGFLKSAIDGQAIPIPNT